MGDGEIRFLGVAEDERQIGDVAEQILVNLSPGVLYSLEESVELLNEALHAQFSTGVVNLAWTTLRGWGKAQNNEGGKLSLLTPEELAYQDAT